MYLWAVKKLYQVVRQSFVLSSLFALSVLIGIFLYSLFYNWYLPTARIKRYIDFGVSDTHQELIGEVNLFDRPTETLHYGQEYSINLLLDLPESDLNFDLGMFGVTLDAVDIDGRRTATFKTMGTLVYKSFLLRCMTTLFYFPYYLFGRFEQRQTLYMPIKENFVDNAYMPAYKIIIKIHGKVQYYSALLNIEAKFTGLKYYIHTWFYLSFFLITSWLTMIVFLILVTSFYDVKSLIFGTNGKSISNKPHKTLSEISLTGKLDDKLKIKPIKLNKNKDDINLRFKENLITFREYLKSNKQSID
ncbi:unnamed protein product [Brachionus calyciflorus]|uniref:Seipin n=1 Tax=Brachionus calyciflorus TaxID=104777 RepID=A0A813SEW5_9BILA|nr:unnamed protein product [Brachionus calyciflorus]